MNKELNKLNDLFNVTFAVFTFWIVAVGYFLATVSSQGNEKILLKWSPIILLYVIAYLLYVKQRHNRKFDDLKLQLSNFLLQLNLVLLGITILYLGNVEFIDGLNNPLEPILVVLFYVMLSMIAFAIPIFLIILLFKFSK